jgi:tRNA(Ile)-lysidine synthase
MAIKKTKALTPITALTEKVAHFIAKHNLIDKPATIVLGLSGGPDSIALLHVLAELREHSIIKEIIAAHLDHQWRPDSAEDVTFCKQMAHRYGVHFISDTLATFQARLKWNGSQEEIGRKARRTFFEHVKKQYKADAIALAHQRDDQLETFFIRLMRGASITGLCSMWPKYGDYIRPLLDISKAEILAYLTAHTIPYLEDPTNNSPDYLRNRIRTFVIPALRHCDSRFDAKGIHSIGQLQETEQYLAAQTRDLFEKIRSNDNGTVVLELAPLKAQPPIMQHRLLLQWLYALNVPFPITERFLHEITRFITARKSSTHHITESWLLEKTPTVLRLSMKPNNA